MKVHVRMGVRVVALFAMLLSAVLSPRGAEGQEPGRILGSVRDAGTSRPLQGAQVFIAGTGSGTVSNSAGAFLLLNVPAGEVELSVELIGYALLKQTVTVTAGGPVNVSLLLSSSALQLDELVVTATGVRRKIEIGNALATISAAAEVSERPISDISQLIQGRATGVQVIGSGGSIGMGSKIRIRGSNSASLSNEPVIYVDGVRIDNDPNSISFETGGQSPNRLNDINPEDIESIEIIKGPSAATLYGSIAANGVIRITTKRGRAGKARWTAFVEGGQVRDIGDYPANFRGADAAGNFCPLFDVADGLCTQSSVASFQPLNDPATSPFRNGKQRRLGLSVSGGSDVITYFVSGNYANDEGVLPVNDSRRSTFRGNFGAQVTDDLNFRLTTGYVSSDLNLPLNDNFALGLMGQGLNGFSTRSTNNGWGEFTPQELFTIETKQRIRRFTSGIEADWRPTSEISFRASGGLDFTSRWDSQFFPTGEAPAFLNFDQGARFSNRFQTFNYTIDVGGTYNRALTGSIDSRTSVGFQYLQALTQGTLASGFQLVSGSSSIAGAATTTSNESTIEQRTAGVFIEEQLDFGGRLFLTAAVRGDKGSAFGSSLDAVFYPKISASWLISEEDFFDMGDWLSSLRLRGAWGDSGVQPGTNDALRFFLPIAATVDGGQNVTGVTFGGVGNSDLKPERSREYEFGLDAEFYSGRAGLELTYYNKKTKDALVLRQLPPSLGVGAGRFENLGSVRNRGMEVGINTRLIEASSVSFDLDIVGTFSNNELVKLGEGIPSVVLGGHQIHAVGKPLGGYWDEPFTFSDANGDGLISKDEVQVGDTAVYLGTPFAPRDISFRAGLNLFNDRVVLTGLLSYRGGQALHNNTAAWRNGNSNTEELNDPNASLANQARAIASKFLGTDAGYIEDATFWRLRELAATFNAPQDWAGSFGASRLSLTVAGRNLGLWTDYSGLDPEISETGQANFAMEEFLSQPPVRMWTARVNVSF
ncbi:MAG: SusC/RagA family TonB-linked outer membrane protein [Longimicrobiales bacterium]